MTEIDGFTVGEKSSVSKSFTEDDVETFARISGDTNPVHLDEAYAKITRFGRRIVHGALIFGLVSAVLGTRLPGPGTIYLQQTLRFVAPVHIGDSVTAEVGVLEVMRDRRRIRLRTECRKEDGTLVLEGEALVQLEPLRPLV